MVGAAASGLRPIVDLMFVGFFGVCGDQIINNAAKMHYMFGGKVTLPLTIMTGIGAGTNSAAQHSETLYSVFTHFPGLKCVCPSNSYNAKGLFTAAIRDDDPVMIFNHKLLMGMRADRHVPEEPYVVPIGKADIAREGTDVTIVGIGYTTHVALQAAQDLESRGYSAEVIDLLSLSPMDNEAILSSVRKNQEDRNHRRGLPQVQHSKRHLSPCSRGGVRLPGRASNPRYSPTYLSSLQHGPRVPVPPHEGESGGSGSIRSGIGAADGRLHRNAEAGYGHG